MSVHVTGNGITAVYTVQQEYLDTLARLAADPHPEVIVTSTSDTLMTITYNLDYIAAV